MLRLYGLSATHVLETKLNTPIHYSKKIINKRSKKFNKSRIVATKPKASSFHEIVLLP